MVCKKHICVYLQQQCCIKEQQCSIASAHIVLGGSRTNRVHLALLAPCARLRLAAVLDAQSAALARARACTNRVLRIRARVNARTMSQLTYTILQNCRRTVSSHIEPLKQYTSSPGKADCSHISNVTGSRDSYFLPS